MIVSILLSALTLGVAPAAPSVGAPSAVVALRDVTGCAAWSHVVALDILGTHAGDGMTGPFHESLDARDGASATVVHEGPFVSAQGFDGTHAWSQDFSGASHALDAPHARRLARTDAWLERRGWCRDGDGTAYRSVGVRTKASRIFDVMSATPPRGEPVTLWIDRTTHLLDRVEERLNESDEVKTFADWRTVGDIAFPFEQHVEYPQDEDGEAFHVRSVRFERARPNAAAFAMPKPPNDVRIVNGASSTRVPFILEGMKPIVNVMLNGRGPFPFVIDTGGHFILTPATAARLGLAGVGSGNELGQGTSIRKTSFTTVRELRLGNAVIVDQPAEIIPYNFRRLERGARPPKAGWLGLQLFERFATTFDPATHMLTFAPFDRRRLRATGIRLPIVFDEDAPLVDCAIDTHAGLCMIDTGNAGPTIVEGHWIAEHGIAPLLGQSAVAFDAQSLGRADVTLGSIRIPREQITFDKASPRGSEATTVEAAILSEGLLNRFVMTVDYQRHAVWLKPIFGAKEPPFDRGGVLADKERDGSFSVWLVFQNSPAARAGIRVDDRITAVDRIPAAKLSGTEFRGIAQGPIGSRHVYRIKRRGKGAFSVVLHLREFLP